MNVHDAFETGCPGTNVLVAGATGGIGSAISRELGRRGAELTLVARRADALDELNVPGRRLAIDLRSAEGCRLAVEKTTADGPIHAVVNAVGVVAFGPVSDLSVDAMEELFLTNTFVPIMLAKAALPHLNPGAVLVNVAGIIAEKNVPGMAAYGASKAAVTAFDQALAREARRSGIRVINARPPHTETGMADRAIEGTAPSIAQGIAPERVAEVICDAIEQGTTDLPSTAF